MMIDRNSPKPPSEAKRPRLAPRALQEIYRLPANALLTPAETVVVTEHDVVLGIFPSAAEGIGLHVIKGQEILRQIASSNSAGDFTHTAIAVHNREQAVALQQVFGCLATAVSIAPLKGIA
jgi:hypothetical protein